MQRRYQQLLESDVEIRVDVGQSIPQVVAVLGLVSRSGQVHFDRIGTHRIHYPSEPAVGSVQRGDHRRGPYLSRGHPFLPPHLRFRRHLPEPHSLGTGFVLHRPPHGGPRPPLSPIHQPDLNRPPASPARPARQPPLLLESRHRELLGVQPIHYDYHVDVRVGRPFSPGDTPEQQHTPRQYSRRPVRISDGRSRRCANGVGYRGHTGSESYNRTG